MWKTIRNATYGLLYRLGKTPPSYAEIEAELDRLASAPSHETSRARLSKRCDCLVTAGGRQVACYRNQPEYACHLIGDSQPGLNGTPLPLGSCNNM